MDVPKIPPRPKRSIDRSVSPNRDAFLAKAKKFGVNIGGSGANAVRLRPMLIFEQHHADKLLETMEKIVTSWDK